jgi:hypothetical protein
MDKLKQKPHMEACQHPQSQESPELSRDLDTLARNALAWRMKAMSHQRAAELLQDQSWMDYGRRSWKKDVPVPFGTGKIESPYIPRLDSVVVVLQAFALHSLLTAMCIDRDGTLEESARTFDVHQTHRLLDLCKQLGIELDSSEFSMVKGMDSVFGSVHRLPTPLAHISLLPHPMPKIQKLFIEASVSPLEPDIHNAEGFLQRLWKLYEEIAPCPEQLR